MLALESATAEAGLKTLSTLQEIDPLCRQTVFETIEKTKDRSWAQKEEIQAEFVMIDSKIEQFRNSADQFNNAEVPQKNSNWSIKLSEYIEAFLDAGDGPRYGRTRYRRRLDDLSRKRHCAREIWSKHRKSGLFCELTCYFFICRK